MAPADAVALPSTLRSAFPHEGFSPNRARFTYAPTANKLLEDIADFMDLEPPEVGGLNSLFHDLGHSRGSKVAGIENVIAFAHDVLARTPVEQRKALSLAFEQRQEVAWLWTHKGRQRVRLYDVTFKKDNVLHRYELKRWLVYPPADPRALSQALDQFERDFVLHATGGASGFDIRLLHWVFPELPGEHKAELAKLFVDRIRSSPIVTKALADAGVNRATALGALERAATSELFQLRR